MSVVTSHPSALVKRWLEIHDRDTVIQLCHHGTLTPPLIVALEDDSSLLTLTPQTNGKNDASANEQGQGAGEAGSEKWIAHQTPGFIVWQKDHASLMRFLAEHPGRRVQDPASARPVSLARDLAPRIILDLCAGRGTKTRQLAQMFPQAQVFASDVDTLRTQSLHELAKSLPNVTVVSPDALPRCYAWENG
ncbi:MAG: hypothetical protein HC898_09745 [Phycisphaerales bacterium]|nr:hypothetical protein [Phycisphaerales bacterium]